MAEDPDRWDARDNTRWCGPCEEDDRGWHDWYGCHGWRDDDRWHGANWWSDWQAWARDERGSRATVVAPLICERVTARDNAHEVQAARRYRPLQPKAAPSHLQVPTGHGAAAIASHDAVCTSPSVVMSPDIQSPPTVKQVPKPPPPGFERLTVVPTATSTIQQAPSDGVFQDAGAAEHKGACAPAGLQLQPLGLTTSPPPKSTRPPPSPVDEQIPHQTGPPPRIRPIGVGPTPTRPPPPVPK